MSSIFGRLFKYRPRPDRDPKEDFFTEALTGVLQTSRALRNAFVKEFIGHEVDCVFLKTQKTVPNGRIDIWIDARDRCSGARHLAAMENKIGADVDENQLRKYETHLQRYEDVDSRTLVSATRHERSRLRSSPDAPYVQFRQVHWFQVADFLRNWIAITPDDGDDSSSPFVRELLLLMKEWSMAMDLNIGDLAAATAYHRSVNARLRAILEQTKAACNLPNRGWGWGGNISLYLAITSPEFGDGQNISVEFGFDFKRDDTDWRVAQLRLPSAYFTVRCPDPLELNYPQGWEIPPAEWGGEYRQVKHLDSLQVNGGSLHMGYVEFFRNARVELWHALGL